MTIVLQGREIGVADGNPIIGADVYAYQSATGTLIDQTTTDANGAWSMSVASYDAGYDIKVVYGWTLHWAYIAQKVQAQNIVIDGSVTVRDWAHSSSLTKIDGGDIYVGSLIEIASSGSIRSGQTAYNTGTGWWIGDVGGTPKASMGVAGGAGWTWDGTTFSVAGTITATAGTIGGFTLSATALYAGTVATRIQLDTTSGIHLGATAFADAPFRVSLAGALVATSATITGTVNATAGYFGSVDSSVLIDSTGVTLLGSGHVSTAVSGARVEMVVSGLKWWDATTQRGQILSDGSGWLGASGSFSWSALGVVSMDGAFINNSTITSGKLSISQLSAIAADLGAITAGSLNIGSGVFTVSSAGALVATSATITGAITATSGSITGAFTIGTGGSLASGATAILTGDGYWLAYNAGTPVLRVGTVSGGALVKGLYWDGANIAWAGVNTSLTAAGLFTASNAVITGTLTSTSGTIGGWTLGATTLTGVSSTVVLDKDVGIKVLTGTVLNNRLSWWNAFTDTYPTGRFWGDSANSYFVWEKVNPSTGAIQSWIELRTTSIYIGVDLTCQGITQSTGNISAFSRIYPGADTPGGGQATRYLYDTGAHTGVSGGLYLAGGQLAFPATQAPSADANTLDDYEEGTWTPSVGGNATYTTQTGRYVKVGKMVYLYCDIRINVLGTGSTTTISGLPFTNATGADGAAGSVGYYSSLATSVVFLVPVVNDSATTVKFESNAASATTMTDSTVVFGNGARIVWSVVYEASA